MSATCEFGFSTDDLRGLLAAETDLFHFIGHIAGRGFQCSDGVLDAETLEKTGATAVLLNGCRSHDQGVALVEAGARRGRESRRPVELGSRRGGRDAGAVAPPRTQRGERLEIVREYTSLGREYVVVGDPGLSVAQCPTGTPTLHHVSEESEEQVSVELISYPVRSPGLGSIVISYLPGAGQYHVAIGPRETLSMSRETCYEAMSDWSVPLIVNEELLWANSWDGTT